MKHAVSRRTALSRAVISSAAFIAAFGQLRNAQAAKFPQTSPAVAYQPSPKDGRRCDGCTLFQAPDSCKSWTARLVRRAGVSSGRKRPVEQSSRQFVHLKNRRGGSYLAISPDLSAACMRASADLILQNLNRKRAPQSGLVTIEWQCAASGVPMRRDSLQPTVRGDVNVGVVEPREFKGSLPDHGLYGPAR